MGMHQKTELIELKGEIDKFIIIVGSIKLVSQQLVEQGDSKSARVRTNPTTPPTEI